MNIHKIISIRDLGERPADKSAGYEYKASLRRLGLGGSYDDYFVNVHKSRATQAKPPFGGSLISYRRRRRTLVALLAVLAVCLPLLAPTVALAHSQLLKSTPPAGAILDTPPTEVRLEMSESVGLQFSTITVYDRTRKEQPVGPLISVDGDPNKVSVAFTSKLAPGSYTVVWRIVSGIDGHLTGSSFAFRVRGASTSGTPEPEGTPEPLPGTNDVPDEGVSQNADPLRWLLRGIILLAAALLTGGPLFTVLIMEPTVGERKEAGAALWRAATRRFAQIGWVAACVLLFALLVDLVAEVASITSTSFFGAFGHSDVALTLIQFTRYGFAWMMKAIAAALLIVLFAWLAYKRPRTKDIAGSGLWELCIAAGSFLLLAEALSSHGAAVEADHLFGLPLPVVSDWLHLVTAAAWVGGLIYMGIALFPAFRAIKLSQEEKRAFLARSIPRFSRLAVLSVVALAATGTYNLVVRTTDLGVILASGYGQLLLAKHILLVVLIGIGAINLLRLSPLLKKQPLVEAEAETSPNLPMLVSDTGVEAYNPKSKIQNHALERSEGPKSKIPGPVGALRRNIRMEIVLTTLVLMCAGGLTLLPPPGGPGSASASTEHGLSSQTPGSTPLAQANQTPSAEATPVPPGPVTVSSAVGGYNFVFDIHPGLDVSDSLTLTVTKSLAASPPLTDVSKVIFKITPQGIGAGMGSSNYVATQQGKADADLSVWKAEDQVLTLDGEYLVIANVQRTQSPDLKAAFRLNLSEEQGLSGSPAEAIEVRVATDPSPPISGTATLTLTVVDGANAPISDAKVSILPVMPSHAHIEPLGEATPKVGEPGVYTVPVHFTMGGGWLLTFHVERNGQPTITTDASLDVIDPNATPTPGLKR